ncbi:unnamed protein product, partial [Amoebophrya sp. A25]
VVTLHASVNSEESPPLADYSASSNFRRIPVPGGCCLSDAPRWQVAASRWQPGLSTLPSQLLKGIETAE